MNLDTRAAHAEAEPEDSAPAPASEWADPLVDPLAELASEPVQMSGGQQNGAIKALAVSGARSGGGDLPHGDRIRAAFGDHDLGGIKAHQGREAEAATSAMGAHAYAMGDDIVFGKGATDLFTAAHEATHVVQQRAGIKPPGGVGSPGDPLEQHANAVAGLVVAGESAEEALSEVTKRG